MSDYQRNAKGEALEESKSIIAGLLRMALAEAPRVRETELFPQMNPET